MTDREKEIEIKDERFTDVERSVRDLETKSMNSHVL